MALSSKKINLFLKENSFFISIGLACLVSVMLLTVRILISDSTRFIFLYWNLTLAIIPAVLAWWLVKRVRAYGWLRWEQIILSVIWLSFLPNSFYLVTDMVHLRSNFEASFYFDVIMLTGFMFNGLALGFFAVYAIHKELKRYLSPDLSIAFVGLIFLLCSFATYLGRFVRWNTWDIVLQPFGLLFDVSDRFINPALHNETFLATFSFFVVLFSAYLVVWNSLTQARK